MSYQSKPPIQHYPVPHYHPHRREIPKNSTNPINWTAVTILGITALICMSCCIMPIALTIVSTLVNPRPPYTQPTTPITPITPTTINQRDVDREAAKTELRKRGVNADDSGADAVINLQRLIDAERANKR